MNWILILVVIVAVFVISKLVHFKHLKSKIFVILVILLLAFLYFSFTTVVKNHSIDIKTASGVFSASKLYFSWFVNIFDNVKTISGNAVGMDWIPKNSSSSSGWDSSSSSSGSEDGWN